MGLRADCQRAKMADCGKAVLVQAIKTQGETVRRLKTDKADKDKVRKQTNFTSFTCNEKQ